MPNVHPGCYSEPLLSAGLAYFWLHKTRGGDEPKKNLMAFPFEYKCYLTPDVSKTFKNITNSQTPKRRQDNTGMKQL